ncbi:TPA: hypothetical protein UM516_004188 [Stenotrophomonas maltophilia]|nr:hypothetical protein [Stenotrophomonas maltophilia]HEL4237844.1 hypothetical protein [Stenotrophomonas maltophilia]
MIELVLDGSPVAAATDDQLASALALAASMPQFELWASVPDGPSLCMLRNAEHAWLMYLREPGDDGFHSCGNEHRAGNAYFRLDNGQVDGYPLEWCIGIEACFAAISFFHGTGGARLEHIDWQP